jgi:hypothetical protein
VLCDPEAGDDGGDGGDAVKYPSLSELVAAIPGWGQVRVKVRTDRMRENDRRYYWRVRKAKHPRKPGRPRKEGGEHEDR